MAKNDEIRRREWLRDFTRYQRIGRRIFGAGIRKAVDNIPIDNITERNYREAVDLNVPEEPIFDAFVRFYFEVGADAGDRTFSELMEAVNAPKQKQFANPVFAEKYRRELIAWARKNLYTKITSVRGDVVSEIIKLIEAGMLEEKSIVEIRQMLKKAFASRNFYNWQIDRITRTETTAAANHGSVYGGTTTGIPLYKRWISLPDNRTRRRGRDAFDHVQMNGKTVKQGEMFEIPGFVKGVPVVDFIEYPGDPRGSAGNVINCRCRVVLIPKRDENGRIRYTDPRFNGG